MAEPLPGTGVVNISTALLREWVMLSAGLEIVDAHMDVDRQDVVLTVKHRDTPIAPTGAVLPTLKPVFQTMTDEDGIRWHRLHEFRAGK